MAIYDITKYGASTSSSDNIKAFSAVITAITKANTPSTILIPLGTFYCSSFRIANVSHLKFNVLGRLQSPTKPSNVHWSGHTIDGVYNFVGCNDLAILGPGTIDGAGALWWAMGEDASRPPLVLIRSCTKVLITGLTISNSPFYHFRILDCNNVTAQQNIVSAPGDSPNTDGFNLQDTCVVEVSDNRIANGDDGIAINSFVNPSTDYNVHNNVIKSGHGIGIGSAIYNLVTRVVINNNTLTGTKYGLRIKSHSTSSSQPKGQPGTVSNVTFSDNVLNDIAEQALVLTAYYESSDPNPSTIFNNIQYNNITSSSSGRGPNFQVVHAAQVPHPVVIDNVQLHNIGSTFAKDISNVTFKFEGTNVGFPGN